MLGLSGCGEPGGTLGLLFGVFGGIGFEDGGVGISGALGVMDGDAGGDVCWLQPIAMAATAIDAKTIFDAYMMALL